MGAVSGGIRRAIPAHLRGMLAIDPKGWSLKRGVRAGLGCCLPVLLAVWTGRSELSWVAFIAFWVALVDPLWPTRTRLLSIALFVAGTAVGCFLAVLVRSDVWASAGFALVWCGAAALTRIWGNAAGSAGSLMALAVLIVLELPGASSLGPAISMAGMTLAGGLWGGFVAIALFRERPDAPVRAAMADVFRTEAAFLRSLLVRSGDVQRRGAVRDAIERARTLLVTARHEWKWPTDIGRRFILMLVDSEMILASLIAVRELSAYGAAAQIPAAAAGGLAKRLDEIAVALEAASDEAGMMVSDLTGLDPSSAVSGPLQQTASWIEAARQHLAGIADGPGTAARVGHDIAKNRLTQLRDNLTFESLFLRYAARLAVLAACLTLLVNGLRLEKGYWITLTAVIVLQPYPSATWERAVQRVAGSIAGGMIAAGAVLVLRRPAEVLLAIVPLSVLGMAFRAASYTMYILMITPLFILITDQLHSAGMPGELLPGLRIIDNLIGASLGVAATFLLWPSWEQHYLRPRLAENVRCNGRFLIAALGGTTDGAVDLTSLRRSAGLAANNAEASLQRALDEPRRQNAHEIAAAMTVNAAARRMTGAAAAIAQLSPSSEGGAELAATRDGLRNALDEIAAAISGGRTPVMVDQVPSQMHKGGVADVELSKAWRQIVVLNAAARELAASAHMLADIAAPASSVDARTLLDHTPDLPTTSLLSEDPQSRPSSASRRPYTGRAP